MQGEAGQAWSLVACCRETPGGDAMFVCVCAHRQNDTHVPISSFFVSQSARHPHLWDPCRTVPVQQLERLQAKCFRVYCLLSFYICTQRRSVKKVGYSDRFSFFFPSSHSPSLLVLLPLLPLLPRYGGMKNE